MSDIPQDVWEAADAAHFDAYNSKSTGDEVNIIAVAILNERRRCLDLCRRIGSPEWSDDTNSGYELAAREIAEDIEKGR